MSVVLALAVFFSAGASMSVKALAAKTDKAGFSTSTEITMNDYKISVPTYWASDIYDAEEYRAYVTDETFAMLIIDVDHFKEVNDTYGHEAGDEVLKKVAAALKSSFRLEDCICRIGGDEFAVLMRQMEPTLKSIVREKIDRVQEKMQLRDDLPRATLSIGVAFTDDEGPEENLFKKADKALYSIKEHGRDGFAFYNELKTGSQE